MWASKRTFVAADVANAVQLCSLCSLLWSWVAAYSSKAATICLWNGLQCYLGDWHNQLQSRQKGFRKDSMGVLEAYIYQHLVSLVASNLHFSLQPAAMVDGNGKVWHYNHEMDQHVAVSYSLVQASSTANTVPLSSLNNSPLRGQSRFLK